jgi:hypothetical protein
MTDNSPSAVGRAAIDAYLDSVEQALIVAHAPRSDRTQVLQDLESQIADMLAQQPAPLTEEMVSAVIAKLEPPSHFAATYGNGKQPASPPIVDRHVRLPQLRWPLVSAISCALLPVGCLLVFLAINTHTRGALAGFSLLLVLVGFVFTPFALWMARNQLRASRDQSPERDLVLKSTIVYGVIAPALVMAFFTAATEGYALVPFGIVAFVYFQYLLIRRVHRYMADATPESAPASIDTASNAAQAPR